MTTQIHDSTSCAAGANGGKCEMCQFASKLPSESFRGCYESSEGVKTSPVARQEAKTATVVLCGIPDFDHEWREAPESHRRYTYQEDAFYWFMRGVRCGELKQMIEENRVFRQMAELRGLL